MRRPEAVCGCVLGGIPSPPIPLSTPRALDTSREQEAGAASDIPAHADCGLSCPCSQGNWTKAGLSAPVEAGAMIRELCFRALVRTAPPAQGRALSSPCARSRAAGGRGERGRALSAPLVTATSRQQTDRPVSSEGRLSQPNVALPPSPSRMAVHMDVPPGEGMEEPTRGPRTPTAH